ncbi:OmpA family protein [Paraburkholderia ferrariae]|uniref:OmpA family protein n=1 Tax=Paraburkholderia ferrariae TaxID=386056 RepID=UPI00047F6DE7|nr:OmpA family protein [Paraburkholderia ferrariae]
MKIFSTRYRIPMIWFAVLTAGLIWLFLPLDWQPWWPVVPVLVLMAAMGAALLSRRGRSRLPNQDEAVPIKAIQQNPSHELPIILVVGPYAAATFECGGRASSQQYRGDAVWMLVRTRAELAGSIATIRDSYQRLPDAVLMPMVPDGNDDDATIRCEFSEWRHELAESAHDWAGVLPCYIAIYACLRTNHDAEADTKPVWFGDAIDLSVARHGVANVRPLVRMIRGQLDQMSLASAHPDGVTRAGLGHGVFDWLEDSALLPIFSSAANTAPLSLHGLLLADIGYWPIRHGAWMRWLTTRTGLLLPTGRPRAQPLPLPLPEVIGRQVAVPPAPTPVATVAVDPKSLRRQPQGTMVHVAAASSVALAVSISVAAWANSRMIASVSDDINSFRHTPETEVGVKLKRFGMLTGRYEQLKRYAHDGVPAELGWGLYRGEALQAALQQAIATWHPPEVITTADSTTIDNLSLFDSGKTTLKPGAEYKLQAALDLIRAHPDRQILIAGHTDNVGANAANLALSEARARAIRDWFVDKASLPVTRFAIQGYGDTRPLASNSSVQGRATNRRVEISLIPDPGTP